MSIPVVPVTGAGHAREVWRDRVGARPPGLAAERLVEWRNALAALDVSAGPTYGLPDSGLEAAEDELEIAVGRTVADAGAPDRTCAS